MCNARLILQGDNTVKEIRNLSTGRACCLLTQAGVFSSSAHCHLMVGHTHEDVDAMLSLVTSALNGEQVLETPNDVMRAIDAKLTPLLQKNNMVFGTEFVDTVPLLHLA